jgi:hypothetical protein
VVNRKTLDAMATALRVHPTELSGQPWTSRDAVGAEAHGGLVAIETALESHELGTDPEVSVPTQRSRYRPRGLGTDPEVTVRAWPEIQADVDRLVKITHRVTRVRVRPRCTTTPAPAGLHSHSAPPHLPRAVQGR